MLKFLKICDVDLCEKVVKFRNKTIFTLVSFRCLRLSFDIAAIFEAEKTINRNVEIGRHLIQTESQLFLCNRRFPSSSSVSSWRYGFAIYLRLFACTRQLLLNFLIYMTKTAEAELHGFRDFSCSRGTLANDAKMRKFFGLLVYEIIEAREENGPFLESWHCPNY